MSPTRPSTTSFSLMYTGRSGYRSKMGRTAVVWSKWPWVSRIYCNWQPDLATMSSTRGASSPGSIRAQTPAVSSLSR